MLVFTIFLLFLIIAIVIYSYRDYNTSPIQIHSSISMFKSSYVVCCYNNIDTGKILFEPSFDNLNRNDEHIYYHMFCTSRELYVGRE